MAAPFLGEQMIRRLIPGLTPFPSPFESFGGNASLRVDNIFEKE